MNRPFFTLAMKVASYHLMLCGIWGAVVLFLSFVNALSDSYEQAAWWLVGMDKIFQFSEAPVVLILRGLYHPEARFEPPGFFAIDLAYGANAFVAIWLCLLWSFIFGCLIAYATSRRKIKGAGIDV